MFYAFPYKREDGRTYVKTGSTARALDTRRTELSLSNPDLGSSLVTFPCSKKREEWIGVKFTKEFMPNLVRGCGEVYWLSPRMRRWFKWAQENLK